MGVPGAARQPTRPDRVCHTPRGLEPTQVRCRAPLLQRKIGAANSQATIAVGRENLASPVSPREVSGCLPEELTVSATPILQIHGQRFPQDPVEIFANTPGLERLINVLIEAVNQGRGEGEFMVRDGFATEVRAARLDGRRRDEDWRRSGSPYFDIDDPLVARIVILTDEVARLNEVVRTLRARTTENPTLTDRRRNRGG